MSTKEATQIYEVVAPNMCLEGEDKKVGEFVKLTDKQAEGLTNKVKLAPTPSELRAKAEAMEAEAKRMTEAAKKLKADNKAPKKGDKE
jgi:hypothetical protein